MGRHPLRDRLPPEQAVHQGAPRPDVGSAFDKAGKETAFVTLALCGDVMTGRGIDQILGHPGDPRLYEGYLTSAVQYVELAEGVNGPIRAPVGDRYIWGDALAELETGVEARIVNLETSVTTSPDAAPKGINYRMHPANLAVLTAAGIDCCVLANNHTLDWGRAGLLETVAKLHDAKIATAGAGRDRAEAEAPAMLDLGRGRRLLVFAFGTESSGIPGDWRAGDKASGVNLLPDLSAATAAGIARRAAAVRRPGDLLLASVHWGANWGHYIPPEQREFARRLIGDAGFHVVHGHSSHHAKAIEIRHDAAILYGCGDFLNDYEGIGGHEKFRSDLTALYRLRLSVPEGRLRELRLLPFRLRRFRLCRAAAEDAAWLHGTLDRHSAPFGTRLTLEADGTLTVHKSEAPSRGGSHV